MREKSSLLFTYIHFTVLMERVPRSPQHPEKETVNMNVEKMELFTLSFLRNESYLLEKFQFP